jgi:hypothetical protein
VRLSREERRRIIEETNQRILEDPGDNPHDIAFAEHVRRSLAAYRAAGEGMFAELALAGHPMDTLDDLKYVTVDDYRDTIAPIMIRWLPRIEYQSLREHIVDWLGLPIAPPEVVPALLAELRRMRPDAGLDCNIMLSRIERGLERTTNRGHFDELARIALDPAGGIRRLGPISALARMNTPEARDVLVRMLGDVHLEWVWTVLAALWKMKPALLRDVRPVIERYLHDPLLDSKYGGNRREAGKIMRKIERHEAKLKQKQQSG